jgi:hypothetical protein
MAAPKQMSTLVRTPDGAVVILAVDADGATQRGGQQQAADGAAGEQPLLELAEGQHVAVVVGCEDHLPLILSPGGDRFER